MNRNRRLVSPVVVALALITAFSACSEPPATERVLRPIRSETVYASGGTRIRSFSGSARAGRETDLSFRVSGSIASLDARVGQRVEAGRTIATLDPTDYDIAVRRAAAALDQAIASLRNQEADLERIRALWENSNASQNELDRAQAGAESARAQRDGAREALEAARLQRRYTELVSPVDGSIASVPVEIDENVRAGQRVVLVTSGTRPEVEVAIPEVLIAEIREGNRVDVVFDALPGVSMDAVVTEVGVAATGAATTFPVTVRLTSERQDVRPGMAATVSFRFEGRSRESIYVPSHAVGEDRQGRYVFLLESTDLETVGTVRRVSVEVGDFTPSGLEILSGLEEGQVIATAGVRRLSDGQRVRLLEDR